MTFSDLQITGAIPLTVEDARWLDERLNAGPFASPEDYLAELVRQDRASHAERLGHLLDEAESSGISRHSLDEIFSAARRMVKANV